MILYPLAAVLTLSAASLTKVGSFVGCSNIPANFPDSIILQKINYRNWAETLEVDNLWEAIPETPEDVVVLVNWANSNGFTVRASGAKHNWSPFTVTSGSNPCSVLLVDTTKHLNKIQMESTVPGFSSVTVQTGALMGNVLEYLENHGSGYGIYATPAPGDSTVGGVIAVGAHGLGIPLQGETLTPAGYSSGSLSNLVLSLTAVVWDETNKLYGLRTFQRNEVEIQAFLTNLGRIFLTQVTLRVGPNYNLRCQSRTDIPVSELFAAPTSDTVNSNSRTFTKFLEETGRVEAMWFPFTTNPWLKVWTVSPTKPDIPSCREVNTPYNYPFSDNIPTPVAGLISQITIGVEFLTPVLNQLNLNFVTSGLEATASSDIWGKSKNVLLYIKPTAPRTSANAYTIITTRSNIQNVLHTVTTFYERLIADYQSELQFPINAPLEIRVSGVDNPEEIRLPENQGYAEPSALSATRIVENHPEFNVAVWFTFQFLMERSVSAGFMVKMESFILQTYNEDSNSQGFARPEWSKGFAFTNQRAWSNTTLLKGVIPNLYGQKSGINGWDSAISTLNKYDPNKLFVNDFLNNLLS